MQLRSFALSCNQRVKVRRVATDAISTPHAILCGPRCHIADPGFSVCCSSRLSYGARARRSSSASSEHSANAASGELAKESREAAGEDEQAQFKHSASVQMVAKLTGLSLDHAYWLCVVLNFAVVAGAVVYFSKKNLPGMFRNRTASIQKAMQEARKASEEANRRLA